MGRPPTRGTSAVPPASAGSLAAPTLHSTTNKPNVTMESHFPDLENTPSRLARERVLADMRSLARDAENLLRVTAGDMSDKAKEARSRVAAALENAKASCLELQEQSLESARVAAKKTDETIRAHPYESIGLAFGIGLLLGAVLRRK